MSNEKEPVFGFEYVLRRRNFFYISQQSLDDILRGRKYGEFIYVPPRQISFERLLEAENLVLIKIDDELSLIRKAKK